MNLNFEEVEKDIEEVSSEVNQNKIELNEKEESLSKIEEAIKRLKGDSKVQQSIESNKESKESEIDKLNEKKEFTSSKIKSMIGSLKSLKNENNNSFLELEALQNLGENVDSGLDIVNNRNQFIDESIKQLELLDEEDGEAFELADSKLTEAIQEKNDKPNNSFQQRRQSLINRLKAEVNYDKPLNKNSSSEDEDPNIGQKVKSLPDSGVERAFSNKKRMQAQLNITPTNQILSEKPTSQVFSNYANYKNRVNNLNKTAQEWHTLDDGSIIYNSPEDTGENLDHNQGKTGISGTCGLVSCENLFHLAGISDITEKNVVSCAMENGLCSIDGGTNAFNRKAVLSTLGINSSIVQCNSDSIAKNVEEGRGVIISVHAHQLWYGKRIEKDGKYVADGHAITVTSVRKNKDGSIAGFYVCDSGTRRAYDKNGNSIQNKGTSYYTKEELDKALTGRPMNVTDSIIR